MTWNRLRRQRGIEEGEVVAVFSLVKTEPGVTESENLKAVGLDHGEPNFNALLRLQNHHWHGRPDICE